LRKSMGKNAKKNIRNFFSEEHNIIGVIKMWENTAGKIN